MGVVILPLADRLRGDGEALGQLLLRESARTTQTGDAGSDGFVHVMYHPFSVMVLL